MNHSLNTETLVTKVSSYAAATTGAVTNGAIIDLGSPTEGIFDSVRFILSPAIVLATGTIVMKAFVGDDSALGDGAYETTQVSVTAPTPTTKTNLPICLDVIRPGKRYVRLDYTLAVANTAVDCILAERYNARTIPTLQPSDSKLSVNAN